MHGMKCFYGLPLALGAVCRSAVRWNLLIFAVFFSILSTFAQGQGLGFISIDCGALVNNSASNITWVSDGNYVATGVNANVSNVSTPLPYDTLRYFPENQSKNCYTFNSIANRSYLVRAGFLYGNYDNHSQNPSFELLFDATHWTTVNISDVNETVTHEMIFAATDTNINVCVARTSVSGSGFDPFISSLEIRLLSADQNMYSPVHDNFFLKHNSRINFGQTNNNSVRYPEDPYDRIWDSDLMVINDISQYNAISTNTSVSLLPSYDKPASTVMQSARTSNISRNMTLSFTANFGPGQYYSAFYFAEILNTQNATRIFDIYVDSFFFKNLNISSYGRFMALEFYILNLSVSGQSYNLELQPNASSNLGPILNAAESYFTQKIEIPTNEQDVKALADLNQAFNLIEWVGDPCLPAPYKWLGLTCSNSSSPRVTALSLANMGLNATISPSIGNLTALTVLDLSNNSLYGVIPSSIVNLSKLQQLDLQNNNLSGKLPSGFGTNVNISVSGNRFLCQSENNTCAEEPAAAPTPAPGEHSTNSLKIGLIPTAIVIFVTCALGFTVYRCKRQRRGQFHPTNSQHWPPVPPFTEISRSADPADGVWNEDKNDVHSYSPPEMETITNNFKNKFGGGSFGILFHGMLPDGQEVVVKKLQSKLQQSPSIFLNKVSCLASVHHRNVLRLSGFCAEYKQQMLIYEFMPKGSLYDHLYDHKSLDWRTRLSILLQVAQGLEHLHFTCSPSIIHGNVKSTNVILSDTLLAKVSDFGLYQLSADVGFVVDATSGYFDPEYFKVKKLTEKSDVYSFGVLILEAVSGRVPFDTSLPKEQWSIVHWAQKTVHEGNCELIADCSLRGNYNINALSKVVQIALQGTAANQKERPTMSEFVMELKEANKLELGHHVAFAELATVDSLNADELALPNGSCRSDDT